MKIKPPSSGPFVSARVCKTDQYLSDEKLLDPDFAGIDLKSYFIAHAPEMPKGFMPPYCFGISDSAKESSIYWHCLPAPDQHAIWRRLYAEAQMRNR